MKIFNYRKNFGQKGMAAVEFALILPILIVLTFGIIDSARFIKARVAVTNYSREIGIVTSRATAFNEKFNLYRGVPPHPQLFMIKQIELRNYLSACGMDYSSEDWRVYVSLINSAQSEGDVPTKDTRGHFSSDGGPFEPFGKLVVASSTSEPNFGLSQALYDHLVYNAVNGAADIADIYIVEVYYKYRPITPLPDFVEGIFLKDGDGVIVKSISYF